MNTTTYIQDAVKGFENLYGGELTEQQRDNLTRACEYAEKIRRIDADRVPEIILARGDHAGGIEVALDDELNLVKILHNFRGAYKDLDEYLCEVYLDELGLTDDSLRAYASLFTDYKEYKRSLEMQGWVFAPNPDHTLTYVFIA